jgi:hypothetical protein
VELLFSDLGGPGVGLVGPSPGTGALDIDFDLDAIELPAAIERVAGEWVLVEAADGPPATGFFLTLVGDRTPKTEEAPPPDSETLEQLRALGYVE